VVQPSATPRGGTFITDEEGDRSAVTLVSLGLLVAAGCGSSKPEFCAKSDDLQAALNTFQSDVTTGNASAIQSDMQTIRTDVDAVVSSAKSDFPGQTQRVAVGSLDTDRRHQRAPQVAQRR
jgi:hypothetical protein